MAVLTIRNCLECPFEESGTTDLVTWKGIQNMHCIQCTGRTGFIRRAIMKKRAEKEAKCTDR